MNNRTPLRRRRTRHGFTLVELMIVVVIIGALAAIATNGLKRFVASAKTAEALQNVGAIGRAVSAAAALGVTAAPQSPGNSGKGKGNGATVTQGVAGLCLSADPVPASVASIAGKVYQPSPADYQTGGPSEGWNCLAFSVESPQHYRYHYSSGGPPVNVALPHGGTPPGLDKSYTWLAAAEGDLDGDGDTSWFVLEGYITDDGRVMQAPAIARQDEHE